MFERHKDASPLALLYSIVGCGLPLHSDPPPTFTAYVCAPTVPSNTWTTSHLGLGPAVSFLALDCHRSSNREIHLHEEHIP